MTAKAGGIDHEGASLRSANQQQEPAPQGEGSTGVPTYSITMVRDFLTVPEDRIDACLIDFGRYLRVVRPAVKLFQCIADEMHGADQIRFTPGAAFLWIDDGENNMTIGVRTPDGEACGESVTITPADAANISRNLDAIAAEEEA